MNSLKHVFFLFFFILVLLCSQIFVSAIGASPAKANIEFKPGLNATIPFTISKNSEKTVAATIRVSGLLSKYVTLSKTKVYFNENNIAKFDAHVNLPDHIDSPGKNIIRVHIVEEIGESFGMVAKTSVVPWIVVFVPYPGRYAEIKSLTVDENSGGVNEGEDALVYFSIINRGTETLSNTKAILTTYLGKEVVNVKEYPNIEIPDGMTYSEKFILPSSAFDPSDYKMVLQYFYDDKQKNVTNSFSVGQYNIDLGNYDLKVEKNGVVPFKFFVRNLWKGYLQVEGEVNINGSKAKTSRENLADFTYGPLIAYIDTSHLPLGNISGVVDITFMKKNDLESSKKKSFPLTFELIEPVVEEVEKEEKDGLFSSLSFSLSNPIIIFIFVVVILLVNSAVLLLVFSSRKKKVAKQGEKKLDEGVISNNNNSNTNNSDGNNDNKNYNDKKTISNRSVSNDNSWTKE